MEIKTHVYLAERIYANISEILPVSFSLKAFKMANVLPDYSWQTLVHPHFAPVSLDYIKKQINQLMGRRFGVQEMPDWPFILRLGRVTHYLCDFFCQVHTNGKIGNPRTHWRYEKAMDRAIVRDRAHFDQLSQIFPLKRFRLPDQLQQALQAEQLNYRLQPGGFDRDIWMAVRFATAAVYAILRACLPLDGLDRLALDNRAVSCI